MLYIFYRYKRDPDYDSNDYLMYWDGTVDIRCAEIVYTLKTCMVDNQIKVYEDNYLLILNNKYRIII